MAIALSIFLQITLYSFYLVIFLIIGTMREFASKYGQIDIWRSSLIQSQTCLTCLDLKFDKLLVIKWREITSLSNSKIIYDDQTMEDT